MLSAQPHYQNQPIALLTQHGKEKVLAPVLGQALGCRLELVTGYDTDLLGTFTRTIQRAGNQLEAARKKARIGMAISGLPLGLASEGSLGPDPFAGMFPWNMELLIFIDDERGLEVLGCAQGKANCAHLLTDDWSTAKVFAHQVGFPEHRLVVRPEAAEDPRIRKDINSWPQLHAAFTWALELSVNDRAFIETDGRAHANPTRMENIQLAAEDLAKKLCSLCPACNTPGFWIVERVAGLPCMDCGAPTRDTRAEVSGCLKCEYRLSHELLDRPRASPSHCDFCNP
jgi:hypothetical protein